MADASELLRLPFREQIERAVAKWMGRNPQYSSDLVDAVVPLVLRLINSESETISLLQHELARVQSHFREQENEIARLQPEAQAPAVPFEAYRPCIRCLGFGVEVFMGDEVTCGLCMGKKRTPKSFDELVGTITELQTKLRTAEAQAPAVTPTRDAIRKVLERDVSSADETADAILALLAPGNV